jgi:tetratricopeptide (TPR) repeat protein
MLRRRSVLAACLAVAAAAHLGCSRGASQQSDARGTERPAEPACACEGAAVVDPALLAFLSRARSAHHAADLSLAAGDSAAAVRALERLVAAPRPAGPPPEVAEVMADTCARLAELRSEAGEFDAAVRDVDAGLKLAPAPSHYQGHLFEVAGVVEERRAKALEANGDREGAASARQRAVGLFERAIAVQDQVITEALRDAKEKPR